MEAQLFFALQIGLPPREGLTTISGRLHPPDSPVRHWRWRRGDRQNQFWKPRRERTTERSEVVRALETKFLRFETRQEQDSVLLRPPPGGQCPVLVCCRGRRNHDRPKGDPDRAD